MEFYGSITCLHRSDKNVLHSYKSGFYEYSPESISEKSPRESENTIQKKNVPAYSPEDKNKR
jgi:hypothetical protein